MELRRHSNIPPPTSVQTAHTAVQNWSSRIPGQEASQGGAFQRTPRLGQAPAISGPGPPRSFTYIQYCLLCGRPGGSQLAVVGVLKVKDAGGGLRVDTRRGVRR